MAAFLNQSASNTAVLATVSATFSTTPTQGNLLVAAVTANVGVGSITITGWTTGKSIAVGLAGGLIVFYKVAGIGESTTVTANGTLATFMDIQIFEYDGIDNASPLDVTGSTADDTTSVTSRSSGASGTLTQANELVFAAVAQAGANGGGASWTNSYTARITTTHLISADLNTTVTTTTNSTGSWTTGQRAAGVILTFFAETGDTVGVKLPLKPRVPILNSANPTTKGLVFSTPFFERGGTAPIDIISKKVGAFSGAGGPSWGTSIYGPHIAFTDNTNQIIYTSTPIQNSLTSVSIEALIYPTAENAANDARIIHKGGKYFSLAYASTNKFEFAVAWVTVEGDWDTPVFAANNWYHVVITYSYSSTTNNPSMYVNGVLQTATRISTPSGSAPTDSTSLIIGNRTSAEGATKGFVGNISYVRYWNRLLNDQEVRQLYTNPWSINVGNSLI